MKKLAVIVLLLLAVAFTVAGSGCIGKTKNYTQTMTITEVTTAVSYSTVQMISFTTETDTITVSFTNTIVKTESTVLSSSTTVTTTVFQSNITFTTVTEVVTFYYGNDGKPNIVYYTPVGGPLELSMNISLTTVYYPSSWSNLYTPVLPVFVFYDKKYYSYLVNELGVSTFPDSPAEYVSMINYLMSRVVIVNSIEYPTFIDAAISSGTMNAVEFANYFVGVGVIESHTPTIVFISNYTTSTVGVIVDGRALVGKRYFENTEAMKAYYYNLFSNHVEYYGVVNPEHPWLSVYSITVSEGPALIGMLRTRAEYSIVVTENIHGIESIFTETGVFDDSWGSFTRTDAIGNTSTAYVHAGKIYVIINTFTTSTFESNPANMTSFFLPAPLREASVVYYGDSKVLLEYYGGSYNAWLIVTVDGTLASGSFVNERGESIGYYSATLSVG